MKARNLVGMLVVVVCVFSLLTMGYAAPPTQKGEAPPAGKDLVQTLTDDGNFKTLCGLITAAGLTDTLKAAGPMTVLAPNDDAFKKLPAGAIDNLMKPENKEQLKAILLYHVLAGKVMAADLMKMKSVKSENGAEIAITTKEDKLILNDTSTVTTADVVASNGVIQVIDTVLMPPVKVPEPPAPVPPMPPKP